MMELADVLDSKSVCPSPVPMPETPYFTRVFEISKTRFSGYVLQNVLRFPRNEPGRLKKQLNMPV